MGSAELRVSASFLVRTKSFGGKAQFRVPLNNPPPPQGGQKCREACQGVTEIDCFLAATTSFVHFGVKVGQLLGSLEAGVSEVHLIGSWGRRWEVLSEIVCILVYFYLIVGLVGR